MAHLPNIHNKAGRHCLLRTVLHNRNVGQPLMANLDHTQLPKCSAPSNTAFLSAETLDFCCLLFQPSDTTPACSFTSNAAQTDHHVLHDTLLVACFLHEWRSSLHLDRALCYHGDMPIAGYLLHEKSPDSSTQATTPPTNHSSAHQLHCSYKLSHLYSHYSLVSYTCI